MEEKENIFKLLDLTGSEETFDYNPSKNLLVYSIGCMIVYWELTTDKKLFIKYHEGIIGYLKFSKSGNYLISIDKLFSPHLVIWEIPSLQIYFRNYIPLNNNYIKDDLKYLRERLIEDKMSLVNDVFLEFLTKNNFIVIINADNKQSLFNFEFGREINLIFDSTIEVNSYCQALKAFPDDTFVTLEEKTVKIWRIANDNKINLITKIHFKQRLVKESLFICEYLKLITLLNTNGSCIILDQSGNFLVSLTCGNKEEIFVCSYIMSEFLVLGGDRGNVYVYALNGFKLLNVFNYEVSNKNKFLLNNLNPLEGALKIIDNKNDNLYKNNFSIMNTYSGLNSIRNNNYGPSIVKIFANEENDVIFLKYSDNSILIKNLTSFQFSTKQSNPYLNIKLNNFVYSHFGNIKDILWLNDEPKTFFTCSDDQSLMLWTYRGDKWVNNYFDILKTFDANLNNFTNTMNVSGSNNLQNLNQDSAGNLTTQNNSTPQISTNYLQILILHPRYQNTLIGGDNKGNLFVFDTETLTPSLKSDQQNLTKNTNGVKKLVVGNFPITSLSFSKNGNYLAIGFSTGLVILTEFYNDCKFCVKLEDHFTEYGYVGKNLTLGSNNNNFNNNFSFSFVHIMKLKGGIKNSKNDYDFEKLPHIHKDNLNFNSYCNLNLNFSNTGNFYYSLNNEETSFRIITLKDSNTFRIQNVTLQKTTFLKSTFKEFNFHYKIKNALVHPSEDYIVVLLEPNIISINRLETGETCGEIIPNMNVYNFKIDPSGLYLALLGEYNNTSTYNNDYNLNRDELTLNNWNNSKGNTNLTTYLNKNMITIKNTSDKNNFNHIISNSPPKYSTSNLSKQRTSNAKEQFEFKTAKTNIAFYELGTGKLFNFLNNNFKISNFKFSNDGRFINISSDSGCVSVWQLPKEMRDNIINTLDEMRKNFRFWDSFRINLNNADNDENYNNNLNNFNYNEIITRSLDKTLNNFNESFKQTMKKKNSQNNNYDNIEKFSKCNMNINSNFYSNENENLNTKIGKENQIITIIDNANENENNYENCNENNFNKNKNIEVDATDAKSLYINPTTNSKINTENNQFANNQQFPNTNRTGNQNRNNSPNSNPIFNTPPNQSRINKTSKSIQTSNKEFFQETNKRKTDEWINSHKYERMGLPNENMRIINKDPSIYPNTHPSVITGRGKGNNINNNINNATQKSNTNTKLPMPNLKQAKIEDISKMRSDEVRNMNIEKAMRELDLNNNNNNNFKNSNTNRESQSYPNIPDFNNIPSASSIPFTKINAYPGSNTNYFIDNNKENKINQVLPDPIDIDEEDNNVVDADNNFLINLNKPNYNYINNQNNNENVNVSNTSNLYKKTKESIADQIEFAYDNIDNFEKMHSFI